MLGAVLAACARAERMAGGIVVSADPVVAGLARAFGAEVVPDHSPPRGMNAAVVIGCDAADAAGADAALVLTGDLPLLEADDIDTLIERLTGPRSVILVPSRDGTGTNAMLLAGPRVLAPQLGPDSLALHTAQARERQLALTHLHLESIALDIDTSGDLMVLERQRPGWIDRALIDSAGRLAVGGSR